MGTPLDYCVILVYFIAILGFGMFFGKYARTTKQFFLGGQRFSWWLIGFSTIASLVGSYSFIKYSAVAYTHGLSSSMSYLNDWFIMPLFLLGWLPIIFFSRIISIPEYFEKRFSPGVRLAATIILLVYMIGYIGINIYTMGIAIKAMLGWSLITSCVVISIITSLYVTAGGQTSVIMTDLIQGILLLVAGLVLFIVGIFAVGGFVPFWNSLPPEHRLPFAPFNSPASFNFVGIFWQDAIAGSIAFYFMNQGILMRFLSSKSVNDARKSMIFVAFLMMPLTALAVASAGWIGRSMVSQGLLPETTKSKDIFVVVSNVLCSPGVFGLIMAALTAALMSTIDTLINAVSAVFVNDIWKPYVISTKEDKYYLNVARISSIATGIVGLALVPVFASFESIYAAHGAFTAAITPAMIVAILLSFLWKRYTTWAAFWTLTAGTLITAISIAYPSLVYPFAHGTPSDDGYIFMRAFFGILVSLAIGIGVSLFTKPKAEKEIAGLVVGTIQHAIRAMKNGSDPNYAKGKRIKGNFQEIPGDGIRVSQKQMEILAARPGDLVFVSDARWWLGGLKASQAFLLPPHNQDDRIEIGKDLAYEASLTSDRLVTVEKIL